MNAWTYGCTGVSFFWRLCTGHGPPWECCCFEHDRQYIEGGDAFLRLLHDARLRRCIEAGGHPVWARLHWWAVRLMGWAAWRWRWVKGRL